MIQRCTTASIIEMAVNVFRKHKVLLTLLGVRPPGGLRWAWLGIVIDFFLVVHICSIILWAYLYFQGAFLYLPSHFMIRIVGITAAVSVLGSVTKLFVFRRKAHVLKELYDELGGLPIRTPLGRLVWRVSIGYEISVAAIIITHNMHIFIDPEIHRSTPFWALSFTSGTKSEILRDFLFQLYTSVVALSANAIGDTLFLLLTSQICQRVVVLSQTVSSIGKKVGSRISLLPGTEGASESEVIKRCIDEHNLLLRLTKDVEELYDGVFLAQIIYSSLDTCLTLFTISQYEDFMEAMNEMLPQFIALFLEVFLYCWGGQMINNHFEMLHLAAYDSEWFALKKEDRSSMLIIQTVTAKEVNLTSTSIFQLNFHLYETICKEVFSYYTIMRQLFSQR